MSSTLDRTPSQPPQETTTRRKLGVFAVTSMIIAASAPLTVVAGGFTTTFAVTGVVGIPLSFLLLGAILILFTVGYAAMSRHITNAGAFYAYVAQGISRPMGVGTSILALVSYNAMQIGVYGLFGFQFSIFLADRTGISVPWWIPVLVCIVVVAILGVSRVNLSAGLIAVLVAAEFAIVLIFDIVSFVVAPEGATVEALDPAALFVPGIGAVLAFGIAAFMGFEGAAIYGEESRDPRRTVARATYAAVTIIAVFYAFSAWAMTVGIGPSQIIDQAAQQGPNLVFAFLSANANSLVSDLAQLLFLTSLFAALMTLHNNVARYFLSLGREGVLPRALGKVRVRSGAPWAGSVTQTLLATIVIAGFAIAGASWVPPEGLVPELFPVVTLFSWLTNTAACGLVLLMALVSVSAIGFFRTHDYKTSLWQRLIAPAIAAISLFVVFVLILLNFNLLLTSDPTAPLSLATFVLPAIILLPAVGGVIWGLTLRRTNPGVYAGIGRGLADSAVTPK